MNQGIYNTLKSRDRLTVTDVHGLEWLEIFVRNGASKGSDEVAGS
jgi:hypothetical protein